MISYNETFELYSLLICLVLKKFISFPKKFNSPNKNFLCSAFLFESELLLDKNMGQLHSVLVSFEGD